MVDKTHHQSNEMTLAGTFPGIGTEMVQKIPTVVTLRFAKIKRRRNQRFETEMFMSAPANHNESHEIDPVEAVVPLMPLVLPLAGGVLIFLLAFIAVFMA
jgi:hypothetical protein